VYWLWFFLFCRQVFGDWQHRPWEEEVAAPLDYILVVLLE
jgi:hypothetical protein